MPQDYEPIERHPLWTNLTGAGDSNTRLDQDGAIWFLNQGDVPDQCIAYTNLTEVDVGVSAILLAPGDTNQYQPYELVARMTSFDYWVGVTMYNGNLTCWERSPNWTNVFTGPAVANVVGKLCEFTVVGNTAKVRVDGLGEWSGTTTVLDEGRVGIIARDWLVPDGKALQNFRIMPDPNNLLTNGGFYYWDSDVQPTSWYQGGTIDANNYFENVNNGLHLVADGSVSLWQSQDIIPAAGEYRVDVTLRSPMSGTIGFGQGGVVEEYLHSAGDFYLYLTYPGTGTLGIFSIRNVCNAIVDRISIKPSTGTHLPLYDSDGVRLYDNTGQPLYSTES